MNLKLTPENKNIVSIISIIERNMERNKVQSLNNKADTTEQEHMEIIANIEWNRVQSLNCTADSTEQEHNELNLNHIIEHGMEQGSIIEVNMEWKPR